MRTIGEVRQQILQEFHIDETADIIRRDHRSGIFNVTRDKLNNFRLFSDDDTEKMKIIALLRDIGIEKCKFKQVLDGEKQLVWDRINQLVNITIPGIKARL